MTPDATGAPPLSAHREILEYEQARNDHDQDLLLVCHHIATIARDVIERGDFEEDNYHMVVVFTMRGSSKAITFVNWNGNKGNYFKSKKGLRQGDSISPYLFVLYMDKLSHLILDALDNK